MPGKLGYLTPCLQASFRPTRLWRRPNRYTELITVCAGAALRAEGYALAAAELSGLPGTVNNGYAPAA